MCPSPSEMGPSVPAPGCEPLLKRLAGSLAHSVNNALTGVTGYLELALRQTDPGSEVTEYLRASLTCAYQAADIVRRIVSFASRSSGPLMLGPVSFRNLAEHAAQRLRLQGPPGILVVVVAASPGWVQGDEMLLQGALDQLLHNALEAMPLGGLLTLRVEEDNGWPCLRVADTGVGMSAQVRDHLFEPFRTTKNSSHLGLGLVLCRETIQAQGGRIQVESEDGRGTTVSIALPPCPQLSLPLDQQATSVAPSLALSECVQSCAG